MCVNNSLFALMKSGVKGRQRYLLPLHAPALLYMHELMPNAPATVVATATITFRMIFHRFFFSSFMVLVFKRFVTLVYVLSVITWAKAGEERL